MKTFVVSPTAVHCGSRGTTIRECGLCTLADEVITIHRTFRTNVFTFHNRNVFVISDLV